MDGLTCSTCQNRDAASVCHLNPQPVRVAGDWWCSYHSGRILVAALETAVAGVAVEVRDALPATKGRGRRG